MTVEYRNYSQNWRRILTGLVGHKHTFSQNNKWIKCNGRCAVGSHTSFDVVLVKCALQLTSPCIHRPCRHHSNESLPLCSWIVYVIRCCVWECALQWPHCLHHPCHHSNETVTSSGSSVASSIEYDGSRWIISNRPLYVDKTILRWYCRSNNMVVSTFHEYLLLANSPTFTSSLSRSGRKRSSQW